MIDPHDTHRLWWTCRSRAELRSGRLVMTVWDVILRSKQDSALLVIDWDKSKVTHTSAQEEVGSFYTVMTFPIWFIRRRKQALNKRGCPWRLGLVVLTQEYQALSEYQGGCADRLRPETNVADKNLI